MVDVARLTARCESCRDAARLAARCYKFSKTFSKTIDRAGIKLPAAGMVSAVDMVSAAGMVPAAGVVSAAGNIGYYLVKRRLT